MKWKTQRDTFLIEKSLEAIPFCNGGVGLEGGERFEDAGEYVEITRSGQLVEKYKKPFPFSIEDEMTISYIHRVIGDCFYEFYYSHCFWYDPRVTSKLLLTGLRLHEGDLPFDIEEL